MEDHTSTFNGTADTKGNAHTESTLSAFPKQSSSLFSKNGIVRRREINGKTSEAEQDTPSNYKSSSSNLQSKKKQPSMLREAGGEIRHQFKTRL